MASAPELHTARLHLRQFCDDDLDAWARITADPETMRYIGNGRALDREQASCSMGYAQAHWKVRGFGLWAAVEREGGALVGRIGLYQPDGWPGLEVGWLVDRDRWGEGFATEGGRCARDWAFTQLSAQRVISVIQPGNAASVRVAEKIDERHAESRQLEGRQVSIYALAREEWERNRSGLHS